MTKIAVQVDNEHQFVAVVTFSNKRSSEDSYHSGLFPLCVTLPDGDIGSPDHFRDEGFMIINYRDFEKDYLRVSYYELIKEYPGSHNLGYIQINHWPRHKTPNFYPVYYAKFPEFWKPVYYNLVKESKRLDKKGEILDIDELRELLNKIRDLIPDKV